MCTALNQVVGVVVVSRTGMLVVTDSKHGNFFFIFSFLFFKFSFLFRFRLGLGSRLVLVVITRSTEDFQCLHENNNRLLFELASSLELNNRSKF